MYCYKRLNFIEIIKKEKEANVFELIMKFTLPFKIIFTEKL